MKRSILTLALAGLVGFGLTARAEDAKPAPKTVTETTVAKVTVLDVNAARHEVTVKDQVGDVQIVTLRTALEDSELVRDVGRALGAVRSAIHRVAKIGG